MTAGQLEEHDRDEDEDYEERVEKLVALTVGVAKGVIPAGQVSLLMYQIAHGSVAPPEIREFVRCLIQITKGERDPKMGADLPPHLAAAVRQTLEQIAAPWPETDGDEVETEGLTLLELLERVGEACTGNLQLWQQLWAFTEQLETDPTTPPEIKTLAVVLRKILAGERQSHLLEDLPPDVAASVKLLLDRLRQLSASAPH